MISHHHLESRWKISGRIRQTFRYLHHKCSFSHPALTTIPISRIVNLFITIQLLQMQLVSAFNSQTEILNNAANPSSNQALKAAKFPFQVPTNHRMDENEIKSYQKYGERLEFSPNRLDEFQTYQDLSRQQSEQSSSNGSISSLFKQEQPEEKQQISKWSIFHNEQPDSGGTKQTHQQVLTDNRLNPTGISYLPSSFKPTRYSVRQISQVVGGTSAPNPIWFDDDNNNNNNSWADNSSSSRAASSSGNLLSRLGDESITLTQAQRALEENLAIQSRLVALLARAKQAKPTNESRSLQYSPLVATSKLSIRQSDDLMRGIVPAYNVVLHPSKSDALVRSQPVASAKAVQSPRAADSQLSVDSSFLASSTTQVPQFSPLKESQSNQLSYNQLPFEPPFRPSFEPETVGQSALSPPFGSSSAESNLDQSSDGRRLDGYYKQQRVINPVWDATQPADQASLDYANYEQPSHLPASYYAADEDRAQLAADWLPAASREAELINEPDWSSMARQRSRPGYSRRPFPARSRRPHVGAESTTSFDRPNKALASNMERQFWNNQPVSVYESSEYREPSSSHKIIHVHSKEEKKHAKYLWPIVGGGLTMLMGFLIISNILLSIPLLAIGASSLFNQGGGFNSQQLVPVYNLSQMITTRAPGSGAGRRRRRRREAQPSGSVSDRQSGKSASKGSVLGQRLETRIERIIDGLVASAGVSRLFAGWSRRQMLKAAYCHRPLRIRQQYQTTIG